ncbi:MAG: signal peptide peptidase SppA [Spirochaetota bacterium]
MKHSTKLSAYFLLALSFFTLENCFISLFPAGSGSSPELKEHVLQEGSKDKILIIPVSGVISEQSSSDFFGFQQESMVSTLKSSFLKAEEDEDIKGIILKIDSPGGTVTASDIIYKEILKFKNKSGIPVVSLYMDIAASGAYYISMATDHIMAHPTTVTGSIGVIMSNLNFKEGLDKLGIKDASVTSGPNKSIGSPFKERSPEQERILQSIVTGLYERFFSIVDKGRPKLTAQQLRPLCDGRVYTANQAKRLGLVDSIGYFDDMLKYLSSMSEFRRDDPTKEPSVIVYNYQNGDVQHIYQAQFTKRPTGMEYILKRLSSEASGPKFMYIWNGN